MTMPETAMDKDSQSPRPKDYIGAARKIAGLEPVAESRSVQRSSNQPFGSGVPSLHPSHLLGTRQGRKLQPAVRYSRA